MHRLLKNNWGTICTRVEIAPQNTKAGASFPTFIFHSFDGS